MKKEEVIENLYSTFKKYDTSDIHYCDCGCIGPDDVKKLASKKLKDLEEDDFFSYHESAIYTWGDIKHYKHFLPRILEVHNQLNGRGMIGLDEISTKLEYAKWSTWEGNEIKAILDFIRIDWMEFVNEKESEIEKDDLAYYSFFFEINHLLQLWKITKKGKGLRNFVHFFYFYGTEILNKGIKIKGKDCDKEFRNLITQIDLVKNIEEEFFRVDEDDQEYSNKISVVIQMIEQNISLFP